MNIPMSRHRRLRVAAAGGLCALLLAAACSVVEVQIGTAPTPTAVPTLAPLPTPTPDIFAQSSQGAGERPTKWDDDQVTIVTIADPHLVFAGWTLFSELIHRGYAPLEYTLVNWGFRTRVEWSSLWLEDAYGVGNVTMALSVQPPWAEEYEQWDRVSTEDFEGWGASHDLQVLDSTLWFSQPGVYQVRADVAVSARDDSGNEDARSASFETRVIALPRADQARVEAAQDAALHQPRLGELEWQGIFLDWRAWNLGPCAVRLDDPALMRQLDGACVAAENGDWQGATMALQTALDLTDDLALTATLRGHIGMLAAVAETWNVAVRNFREALDLWTAQGDTLAVAITLHNLGIMLIQLERWEEGLMLLSQGWRLRGEIGDHTGNALTWGQFGVIWDDPGTVEGASSTLHDYGMTVQGDALAARLGSGA